MQQSTTKTLNLLQREGIPLNKNEIAPIQFLMVIILVAIVSMCVRGNRAPGLISPQLQLQCPPLMGLPWRRRIREPETGSVRVCSMRWCESASVHHKWLIVFCANHRYQKGDTTLRAQTQEWLQFERSKTALHKSSSTFFQKLIITIIIHVFCM